MYTQCPDCETPFRVTAAVLQQAAGRVRCGRCGCVFSALESLSEDPPEPAKPRSADSSALLETLNELPGTDDVRIEDTGVEWRVVDETTIDPAAEDDAIETDGGPSDRSDAGDSSPADWRIEDTAPPGSDTSVPRISDEVRKSAAGAGPEAAARKAQQSLQLAAGGDDSEELRYDDNTPLPDGFAEETELRETPRRRAEDHIEPRSPEFDEMQVDLALGEADEWMDLLDEVGTEREGPAETPPAAAAAPGTTADSARDTAGRNPEDLEDTDIRSFDDDVAAQEGPRGLPRDIDTQFDLQALAMGIDLTGNRGPESNDDQERQQPQLGSESAATMTRKIVTEADEAGERTRDTGEAGVHGQELASDYVPAPVARERMSDGRSAARDDGSGAEPPPAAAGAHQAAAEEVLISTKAGDRSGQLPAEAEADDSRGNDIASRGKADALPLTDEEMSINLLIDQDLMRFAEEQAVLTASGARERMPPRDSPQVETIIMEGEFVHNALDQEPARPLAGLDAPPALERGPQAGPESGRDAGKKRWPRLASSGTTAGVVLLGLLLLAQAVHAWRHTLAKNSTFDRTLGAVYRMAGDPVVPGWDARGWQFETTSGNTNEAGDRLHITSRIANRSDEALPYPLMYLSMTDRWEETVGATVLKPAAYLASDTDPQSQVPAGESFAAVITVRSLSPEATGFKLNVCYRASDGQLRCAIDDFKN